MIHKPDSEFGGGFDVSFGRDWHVNTCLVPFELVSQLVEGRFVRLELFCCGWCSSCHDVVIWSDRAMEVEVWGLLSVHGE